MRRHYKNNRKGLTLIELVVAVAISVIVVLTVGTLLASGQRSWNRTYSSAFNQIKSDAQAVTIAFGSWGRRSNRVNYTLYNQNNGYFTQALPTTGNPDEVVFGEAVEFRYWDVELDKDDSHGLVDNSKVATAYVLFYFDDDKLKADYGPYPSGAIPNQKGYRNTTGVSTMTLARNVKRETIEKAFSHTTISGVGQGSVRINIKLVAPDTGETITILTSTMLRNIWPK